MGAGRENLRQRREQSDVRGVGGRDDVTFTPSMSDNGISIGNELISALLGTGLKFDTEKKITLNKSAFVKYTDDEITNLYNSVII